MSIMSTLHEICVKYAKKQTGMADSLTEDAPIMRVVRWKESSHGLWNVAEAVSEIEGPAFVEPDAPLPAMRVSSDLRHTDLSVMGGTMQVPTMRAKEFGGPARYFAERQNLILKKAGMDTEIQLVKQNWLAAAKAAKNMRDAGATAKGWFILAVRFDEINNIGLFDPKQFVQGRLFTITSPYDGAEHLLTGDYAGVYGYSIVYRASFGWQILDAKRTCAAIVNIDETHAPTATMIDDALADVRAQPGSTFLFCGPKAKIYGLNSYKLENIQLANGDVNANTRIETWNGIPIIVSHNFTEKMNKITVPTA